MQDERGEIRFYKDVALTGLVQAGSFSVRVMRE